MEFKSQKLNYKILEDIQLRTSNYCQLLRSKFQLLFKSIKFENIHLNQIHTSTIGGHALPVPGPKIVQLINCSQHTVGIGSARYKKLFI